MALCLEVWRKEYIMTERVIGIYALIGIPTMVIKVSSFHVRPIILEVNSKATIFLFTEANFNRIARPD